MPAGFLYVLINPSMPGLAKVGKTARNPTDRVAELSSATGVPSPFMLAFQQPVSDCDFAELWVHRELEREGFRHADNREFFNAPLHEIIQVVAQAANLVFDMPNLNDSGVGSSDSESSTKTLADELFNFGMACREGNNSVLRNKGKALGYFEQAAALGHASACYQAGSIYHFGTEGVRKDMGKALVYYSKAVLLGNWQNEAEIAEIFLESKQEGAAQAHWRLFFERACEEFEKLGEVECEEFERDNPIESEKGITLVINIMRRGTQYCESVTSGQMPHCVPDDAIACLAPILLRLLRPDQEPDMGKAEILRKARRFVEGKVERIVEEKVERKEQIAGGWSFKSLFK